MTVIIVAGYPGSGKTELARMLAKKLRWALIDKDTVTTPFANKLNEILAGDPHDRDGIVHSGTVRPLEYESLDNIIFENLALGVPLVVTAPFGKELARDGWREEFRARAREHGSETIVVWIRADHDAMRRRIKKRNEPRDEWKRKNWHFYASGMNVDQIPAAADVVVENSEDHPGVLRSHAQTIVAMVTA